jgi:hypothetical protein
MRRQRRKAVEGKIAEVGDYVNVKVDKRDVSNPQGLFGVALDVKKPGGCLVVTRHGLITYGTPGKKDQKFYIPIDRYEVLPKDLPVHKDLTALRDTVLDEDFDYDEWSKTQVKTSMQKAHNLEHNLLRTIGCNCKKAKCSYKTNCSCVKAGFACDSGRCKCHCRCSNPHNPRESSSSESSES